MDNGVRTKADEEGLLSESPRHSAQDLLEHGWTTLVPSNQFAALSIAALSTAKRLFDLPSERKHSFARPELGGHVGWRGASEDERPDEVWQVLVSDETEHWPEQFRTERAALNSLGKLCAQVTADIVGAVAKLHHGLTLVGDCVSAQRTVVRLLHYRPQSGSLGFAPHTDLGITTVFAGESVDGLELRDARGNWIRPQSQWILAAGEILSICSRGQIRPACHRVVSVSQERWAVAVFVHPEPDFDIGFDEEGVPLTAQVFFERAMAAYRQEGSSPQPKSDRPSGENGCRTALLK